MRRFQDLKTGAKLALGFGLCLGLALVVGGFALTRMAQTGHITELMYLDARMNDLTGQVDSDLLRYHRAEKIHLLSTTRAEKDRYEHEMRQHSADLKKDLADFKKLVYLEKGRNLIKLLEETWPKFEAVSARVVDLSNKNQEKAAQVLSRSEARPLTDQMEKALGDFSNFKQQQSESNNKTTQATVASARNTVVGMLSAAILLGIVAGWFITRLITGALTKISAAAAGLAIGDIDQQITIDTKDEIGNMAQSFKMLIAYQQEMARTAEAMAVGDLSRAVQPKSDKDVFGHSFVSLITYQQEMAGVADAMAQGDLSRSITPKSDKDVFGNAFNRMVNSLSQLVGRTRVATDSIAAASSQVASGSEDLSQRTTEQAASLEETASSMEEMTSTVKQNADNARQANQLAAQAREMAQNGGKVVSEAVSSMQAINGASKRIADIISVIDEIAFQTNLLALNAAVEAARVGEQGKGFAVVAAEVRNLAGRSATAAKEIKALVADSVQKVHEGSSLVNRSGEQLEEIVNSVKKVADIIAEIAAASTEQAAGIEQVNKAVMQMDQITQENAALVEEATASSQAVNQQAAELQRLVAQFKLEGSFLASLQAEESVNRAKLSEQASRALQATGTEGGSSRGGRGGSRFGSKPKLSLSMSNNDKERFEEF